jgi:8-oxo-dGTP diphosphatase
MPLYLVRHAKAGSRASWHGDDLDRPLSKTGGSQSTRLAKWLGKEPVSRVLSSPYVRCVQTVQPLAERLDLKVEAVDELAEHGPFEPVIDLLERLDDHSVVCTHGDILLATLDALVRRGLVITGRPDFRKGAIWVLSHDNGEWQTAKAHPPR